MRLGPIKLLDSALCLHVWSATASLRAYDESPGVFLSSIAERNHSACSVSERAKLCARCLPLVFLAACASERVTPVYDPAGAIRRLDYDTDRDGRVDMRAYLENGRTVRIEADGNGDGRIDQWQRFDGGKLRELLLDTSQASGRPDRRLVYANDGSVQSVDSDVSPK